MRIVCISDTHGMHDQLTVPNGDILIHAGDFTRFGATAEVESFFEWFTALPHKHKIVVPGNHEVTLCDNFKSSVQLRGGLDFPLVLRQAVVKTLDKIEKARAIVAENGVRMHFLVDREVTIEGIKIYGSPWTTGGEHLMTHCAFSTTDPVKAWNSIPNDVDILVTHMPPYGILDTGLGCHHLKQRVDIVKPYLHVFGHMHAEGGRTVLGEHTVSINAAIMDDRGVVTRPCGVVHDI